jgi:hypothetical protein
MEGSTMNGELYIIVCAVIGALLWPLGGTEIPYFKRGFKWIRRELLPILWGLAAYSAGIEWWRCLGLAIFFDIVFRLPYGDRTPVPLRIAVFTIMPIASVWIGFTTWQAISMAICPLMWILSNWRPTARAFPWVVSCIIIGLVLGITVGQLIAQTF